ncbi:tape measure protein [Iodobacter sp. CM08]|uniref:tape measure protein n=1 Tax=Iodobacter sp. CM08 TaxID=3085902 RepID=UPI002982A1A0|nr:tape measure protein [Iodobacter sp. CM08]MDW5417749.1 tape measure protein [Iodobacter sp. CM08]
MANNELQIRITADGRVLVAEAGRASRAIQSIGESAQQAGAATESGFSRTRRGIESISTQLSTLRTQMLAYLGTNLFSGGFSGMVEVSDALTNLDSRLKLVTHGTENLAAVQAQLFASSQKAQTSYQDTSNLFVQMARATSGLGVQQGVVLDFTDKVSKGLVVSGAAAEGSKAALLQFAQAMQSGVLRGEEFNSINEQAPFLLDALASGLGKARGDLKGLADDGQLTADIVFPAMLRGLSGVDAQFGQMAPTVGRATQALSDHSAVALHEFDKQSGASKGLASAITFLNQNLDGLVSTFAYVAEGGALLAAVYTGKMVGAFASAKVAALAKIETDRAVLVSDAEVAASALVRAERMQALSVQDMNRARAAVVAAEQQVAAEVAVTSARQTATLATLAADRERYASTAMLIRSEIQLEQTRLRAQISDIGRAQRTAALASLSLELAAANMALVRAENALAVAEAEEATSANLSTVAQARLTAVREASVIATGEAAAATEVLRLAKLREAEASLAAAGASGAFGVAMAMLGGPIGIAVIALGLLAFNWDEVSTAAANAADKSRRAVTDIEEALKKSKVAQANDGLATLKTEYVGSRKKEEELKKVPTAGMPDYAKAELNAAIAAESERGERIRDAIQKADLQIAEFKKSQQEKALVGSGRILDANDARSGKYTDVPVGMGVATTTKDYLEKRRNDAQLLSDALKEETKEYQRQLKIADGNADLLKQVNESHQNALKKINEQYGDKAKKGKGAIGSASDTQIAALQGKIQAAEQESITTQKLNEGQRQAITIGEQLALVTDKKVRASLEEKQALAEQLGAIQQHNEVEKDYIALKEKQAGSREKELAGLRNELLGWQEKVATFGMAKSAIDELELSKLDALLTDKEWAQALDQSNIGLATEIQFLKEKRDLMGQKLDAQQQYEGMDAADKSSKKDVKAEVKEQAKGLKELEGVYRGVFQGFEDQLVSMTTKGEFSFRGMIDSMISDLMRLMIRQQLIQPMMAAMTGGGSSSGAWTQLIGGAIGMFAGGGGSVSSTPAVPGGGSIGSFYGFANGGIMTPMGNLPLSKYANGGIATSPQVAIFGEGRHNEAFVPLPDGRSIPVSLRGGGGQPQQGSEGDVYITLSPQIDARGADAGALTRIETALAELAKNVKPMALDAVRQAQLRNRRTPQF